MKYYIVHYNTPVLTECCCKSIIKNDKSAEIIVFDNSDKFPFNTNLSNVKILDNTKGQLLNINIKLTEFIQRNNISEKTIKEEQEIKSNFGSYKHCISVQWIFEHETESFVLLDSDVLLKKECNDLITDLAFTADIENIETRIWPFIVYFNIKLLKEHKIDFLDGNTICPAKPVDTGYYFLQSCLTKKIKFNLINYKNYVVHYGNGSWKNNGNSFVSHFQTEHLNENDWLKKYKELYEHY